MCFVIHPLNQKVKIATEDIPCYKILEKRKNRHVFVGYFKTCYKYFDDRIKSDIVIHESKLNPVNNMFIHEGLHSCITNVELFKKMAMWLPGYIVEAYIPKGSRYFINPSTNEYVSDKLAVYTRKEKRTRIIKIYSISAGKAIGIKRALLYNKFATKNN